MQLNRMTNSCHAALFGILALMFTTGKISAAPPGVVITHSPVKSLKYIGSPSIAILPNGDYVASHDFFMKGDQGNITQLFASIDRGQSWTERAVINGQWWSTLFVHNKKLYLMGTSKSRGYCVIRRSDDGGKSWTQPKNAQSGLLLGDRMYHTAPMPVLIHAGRIWRTMEDGQGEKGWDRKFKSFMMSAAEDADLLQASSWTSSNHLAADTTWLNGKFVGWFEGNAVAMPDGKVVNVLRVQQPDYPEKAAIVSISADGKTAQFDTNNFVDFPGGAKKFTIRFDSQTKKYWTLANSVPKEFQTTPAPSTRNTLTLNSSTDLRSWKIEKTILKHDDVKNHGFQYVDWQFDGEDLIAAVRTATEEPNGQPAKNNHDANYLTFHRIESFRK